MKTLIDGVNEKKSKVPKSVHVHQRRRDVVLVSLQCRSTVGGTCFGGEERDEGGGSKGNTDFWRLCRLISIDTLKLVADLGTKAQRFKLTGRRFPLQLRP